MINGVELVVLDQPQQVRKFQGENALRLQQKS